MRGLIQLGGGVTDIQDNADWGEGTAGAAKNAQASTVGGQILKLKRHIHGGSMVVPVYLPTLRR